MSRGGTGERLQRAVQLQNAGDLDAAEAIYRQVLGAEPRQPDALHLMALLELARGRVDAAVAWAQRACASAPRIANFHNTAGEALRRRGDLGAASAALRRAIALDPRLAMAQHNLAGVLAAGGELDAAWRAAQAGLALGAADAAALLQAHAIACRRGDFVSADRLAARLAPLADAAGEIRRALAWQATLQAGQALQIGDFIAAEGLARRALEAGPRLSAAWNELGVALREQERVDEAEWAFSVAVASAPAAAQPLLNLAALLREDDRLDAAEAYLRALLRHDADSIDARFLLARVLLQRGDWGAGWPLFEARWDYATSAAAGRPERLWQGEPLAGRSIELRHEEGYGDILQMLRFVPAVARLAASVTLVLPGPLLALARRSCGAAPVTVSAGPPASPADVVCPLFNLPRALAIDAPAALAVAPYLVADPARVAAFRERLAAHDGLKVGLAWRGAAHVGNRRRNLPESAWQPLLACAGVSFVSLHHDAAEPTLAGRPLLGVADALRDFDDLAALIAALDLVISVDSAPAHLAGGLGVPCWTLVPRVRDWRWGCAGDDASPWYPGMRLFRQQQAGDWTGPIAALAAALGALAAGREEVAPAAAVKSAPRLRHRYPLLGADCRHGAFTFPLYDRYIGRSLLVYGEYSEAEVQGCLAFLRPGDVVADVGANLGALTVPLARAVGPAGRVLAFEPQAAIFDCLQANLRDNDLSWATAHRLALGAAPGSTRVPVAGLEAELNFGGVSVGGDDGEAVAVATLDQFALPACRLIKVDVEGSELAVLSGARETLQRCRPVLLVECDRADKWPALRDFLLASGYRVYAERPPLYAADNYRQVTANLFPQVVSGNLLCLPSEWPPLSGHSPVDAAGL